MIEFLFSEEEEEKNCLKKPERFF